MVVTSAGPSITTQTGGAVVLGSGNKLTDSATLSGGYNPTGTITFVLTNPNGAVKDTEPVTVSGNGTYTVPTGFVPDMAGIWHWVATYGGDSNNQSVARARPMSRSPSLPPPRPSPPLRAARSSWAPVTSSPTPRLSPAVTTRPARSPSS